MASEKELKEEQEKEQKQIEKEKKVEAKIFDEKDDNFSGFISFQIVDEDGLGRVTKGSYSSGTVHASHADGKVKLESFFTPNPLYYMQVSRESNQFITGRMWYGEAKESPLNIIGKVVPASSEGCYNLMEKNSVTNFQLKVELPFLKNSPSRLAMLTVTTKEEKFVCKVVSASLELTEADWAEWKNYRLKFWRVSKAWAASPPAEKDDDEKKDDKKDDKKKDDK